ncbi:amino acid ABC transporter substrate-binding protein [Dorea acetigenes]|uniref:Amino acid ABC transporter substrate-binding protein n=1 Tax=Dorea acetigenes TaxID=2981787 RepID=A0ABT2RKM6_9FIRM|nr:amino acid ABC transporter substrate-binding protein [Dorea acetigenes]MCU6685729.1 amino acid ABC transporter substrate-binding protein [Dorea acetigenes]SCI61008.1 Sulfate starvation-induced protein 7 [uncultured Clostridium sp.]
MKKRLALLLAAVLTLTAVTAGCGSKEETENKSADESSEAKTEYVQKEEGDEFIVGFDQDFPPMGFVGDDGEYTGFDLELAEEVCNRMGWKFTPKPIAWDSKDAELASGGIDCIWNGFTINGREDDYTWSDAYLNNKQVFVVREDSGIETEADLAGKVVDVQTDSSAQAALDDNQDLVSTFANLQVIPDYNTGFMDLESGAVDAVAMDIVVASYQIEKRSAAFKILDYEIAAEEYGVGFAKGNEALRDQVQSALEEMAKDGTLAEISTKWFGEDITTIGK